MAILYGAPVVEVVADGADDDEQLAQARSVAVNAMVASLMRMCLRPSFIDQRGCRCGGTRSVDSHGGSKLCSRVRRGT